MLGEEDLWKGVILQAIHDARNGSEGEKVAAMSWFLEPSADFNMVCDLAGWDKEIINDNAKRMFKNEYEKLLCARKCAIAKRAKSRLRSND